MDVGQAAANGLPELPEGKRWYVLKVQSNRERTIRDSLLRRIRQEALEEYFGEIVIPTEKVAETKGDGQELAGTVLETGPLHGIVAYEPSELVVTVRAGTPLAELEAAGGQARELAERLEAAGRQVAQLKSAGETSRAEAQRRAASEAETQAKAEAAPPAYAVVDMRLEDGNGLDVVAELAKMRPQARSIVLTGYGNIATAVSAVKLGAVDYLAKPADADDVTDALLNQTPRQKTIVGKTCPAWLCPVVLDDLCGLFRNIHDLGNCHLHSISQFVLRNSG